jgi:membrane-bound ClpP family serine protease
MLRANRVLAYLFLALGVALLVETVVIRGGTVGYLAGAVFLLLGWIRLRAAQ